MQHKREPAYDTPWIKSIDSYLPAYFNVALVIMYYYKLYILFETTPTNLWWRMTGDIFDKNCIYYLMKLSPDIVKAISMPLKDSMSILIHLK